MNKNTSSAPKISIIISTYNRCEFLSQILSLLCKQEHDGSFDFEIIIVDNNSNDQTRTVIEDFVKKYPRMHYVFEPKQGISNARNAGIRHAKGEILVFTDDDVVVNSFWISNIAAFADKHDFDAIGGRVLPIYPPNTPQWIQEHRDILNGPIVCHDYGETMKLYDKSMLPFVGANMVIKRRMFQELGGFNPDLGPGKGTMGDDTEYFKRLIKADKKIFYNPHIFLMHPVIKERMRLNYIAKWWIAAGKYSAIKEYSLNESKTLVSYFGIPRYLFRQLIGMIFPLMLSVGQNPKFILLWAEFFCQLGKMQAYHAKAKAAGGPKS